MFYAFSVFYVDEREAKVFQLAISLKQVKHQLHMLTNHFVILAVNMSYVVHTVGCPLKKIALHYKYHQCI